MAIVVTWKLESIKSPAIQTMAIQAETCFEFVLKASFAELQGIV